ncbi:hypothetical protein [Flavisphingomonas formosensis]|uniref:hypothetical protein n=1 Tax=Flavisphingomonas formosensis TaxID=861534 RepID=UPI0012F9CD24|nr:hypothetical protein [Sphingomonas formosensis]
MAKREIGLAVALFGIAAEPALANELFSVTVPASQAHNMARHLRACGLTTAVARGADARHARVEAWFSTSIDYKKLDCALRAIHPEVSDKGGGFVGNEDYQPETARPSQQPD